MRTIPDGLAIEPRVQVRSFSFSFDGKREKARTRSEPLLTLVMRDEFDAVLVPRDDGRRDAEGCDHRAEDRRGQ
jgi:hypothetical protein